MKFNRIEKQKGLVALITVLIILVIALIIGIGLSLRGIAGMKMSLQEVQSAENYYLASLCAEQALMKLKENRDYSGGETIDMQEGQCTILPIEGRWVIKVSATSSNQVKKMIIVVEEINPRIIISSWGEVADF
jgi:Tfp pilus assembly protein PilV